MEEETIDDYIESRDERTEITLFDGTKILVEENIIHFIDKLGECYRNKNVIWLEYIEDRIKIPIWEIKSIEVERK